MIGENMNKLVLKTAGYVALVNAFLSIPLGLTILYYSVGPLNITTKFDLAFLTAISTGIMIYLVLILRRFLQIKFNFHEVDQAAVVIVVVALFYAVNDIVATFLGPIRMLNNINVGLVTFLGLSNIYFAHKLNKLEDNLFGIKKTYCFLTMATGILLASVFLSALSIVPGLISDICLGTIFILASREARVPEIIS
jgi:hypothetical protein